MWLSWVITKLQYFALNIKKEKKWEARKKNNETEKCRKSEEKCSPKYIAYSPKLTSTPALSLMTVVRWRLAKPGIITIIPLNRSTGGNFPYVF